MELSEIMRYRTSIKVSDYFKLVHPEYSVLKIVPDTSIRNYDTEAIARVICSMYSLPVERMKLDKFQFSFTIPLINYTPSIYKLPFTYKLPCKTSFFIDISTNDVNFYIIAPEEYENLITEKCSNTWPKSTIQRTSSIKMFSDQASKYEMVYKKEDALSLKVDRKSNEPLNSILSVLDIMEGDDRVGIYYNFMPGNQQAWRNKHRDTMNKIKKNLPIDKNKLTITYIAKLLIDELMKILIMAFEEIGNFLGEGKNITEITLSGIDVIGKSAHDRLSSTTLRKEDRNILDTQIMVLSDSMDSKRKNSNAIAVCESFKTVSEDNSLIYRPYRKNIYFNEYKVKGAAVNHISTEETTNFLQVPGRSLLQQHKNITKVDILESPVPDELAHGYISLGKTKYRGVEQEAFLRDEYNQGNLPLTVMGPQGAGKTTYFANYVKYAHSKKESVIVIDFIKNCELSQAIEEVVPKEDLLIINLGDHRNLQGLGYNEIKFKLDMDEFEILELANLQAQQTMALIDAVNNEGLPLTSKMRRYLSSASNVVFLNEGANIRDVVNCLQNFKKRDDFLSRIPENLVEQLEDEINTLRELDDITISKDKDTKEVIQEVTGTKDSKIDGILDRINLLKEDSKLKFMFNKSLEGNMDLVDAVEQGKIILIKMPELKFPLPYVKNVLVTYFTTKVWLTSQIRGSMYDKPKRFHVIMDEVYQAPTCERILKEILPQSRKFGCKFVISCHYLSQIDTIREALKASGSSYMLFQGTDKKNYEELKEELQPYELEDLLNLKQFHSLNLIKYEKGYAKFITKLPKPVK